VDSLAGLIGFEGPDAERVGAARRMMRALSQGDGSNCEDSTWTDGYLALACHSDGYAPDSRFVWLGSERWICLAGKAVLLGDNRGTDELGSYDNDLEELGLRIVEAYDAEGPSAFQQLSGSFLLVTYDVKRKRLLLVSDRLASRPLFYARDRDLFLFATDIRSILSNVCLSRRLDLRSVVEFLRFTMIFGDRTLYKDIFLLPPGSVLTVDQQGVSIDRYWFMTFLPATQEQRPIAHYAQRLAETFVKATDRMTDGLDGVGLMLSGGLDSRMVAAALQALGRKPKVSVTFCDFENLETVQAERVARTVGFEHTLIRRPPDYYHSLLRTAVDISNGCYLSLHGHMLGLKDQIRDLGVRTLVWGWGLDLLFGSSYWPRRSLNVLGTRVPTLWLRPLEDSRAAAQSLLHQLGHTMDATTAELFPQESKSVWLEWPRQICAALIEEARPHASNPHDQLDLSLASNFAKFRSFIFVLSLRYCARERCIMFDNDLLDLFLEMPTYARQNGRAYKKALVLLNPRLARIPDARTAVPFTYPESMQNLSYIINLMLVRNRKVKEMRAKHPAYPAATADSYPNADTLLRQNKAADTVRSFVCDGKFSSLGIVNTKTVERMLNLHLTGRKNYGYYLCALITLALWMEEWG